MRPTATALVLSALCGSTSGCIDDRDFFPIVVDISANCNRADVVPLVTDLNAPARPWTRVLAAAVDDPAGSGVWLLVEYNATDGFDRLGLWHVTDDQIDAKVDIDVAPNEADSLELQAGPQPGQAWLVRAAPSVFGLWRVDANDPDSKLQAVSGNLAGFPGALAKLCDEDDDDVYEACDVSDWPRHLAFLNRQPHIVSVAPLSPTATTFVYVARLEPALVISEQSQLEFFKPCPEDAPVDEFVACDEEKQQTRYPSLELLGHQLDPNTRDWKIFLLRFREVGGLPQSWEPVVVNLYLNDAEQPEGGLRSQVGLTAEQKMATPGPPSGVAVDDFAAYLLHTTTLEGPRLTRLDDNGADFIDLPIVELDQTSHLLQLDSDIAVGRLVEDGWEVIKLFPDAPERSQTLTWLESGPIDRVEPAGVGAVMLHPERGGPDVVMLRCAEATSP